jgi:hypothetical protein
MESKIAKPRHDRRRFNVHSSNPAFRTPFPLLSRSGADFPIQDLRIISRPRAYIETVNAGGRGPEVAQNARQRIISNGVS